MKIQEHVDWIAAKYRFGLFKDFIINNNDYVNWKDLDNDNPIIKARLKTLQHEENTKTGKLVLLLDFDVNKFIGEFANKFAAKHHTIKLRI